MSEIDFDSNYTWSWLILKWWVMPLVAVLAGFFLGAVLRFGVLNVVDAGHAFFGAPQVVASSSYNCSG